MNLEVVRVQSLIIKLGETLLRCYVFDSMNQYKFSKQLK